MQTETLLYIILAGIIALGLALFQYFTKKRRLSKLNVLFTFLRFLTFFSTLLLIINPSFDQIKVSVEKPNLVLAIDNSSSVKYLNQDESVLKFIDKIKANNDIQNKFNIDYYTFGENLKSLDSMSFSEKQTNISKAFTQLSQLYKQTTSPTLLISDGNQTYGNDYQFSSNSYKQPIYPIILGDTITYTDLKIQQFNVNKYAYLKNRFPIEAILVYNGSRNVSSKFVVKNGNTTVYSKSIDFSKNNNSKVINFTLPANSVGVSNYKATLVPIENEKNIINNSKNFAVEVINQKTKIAIVSDFSHPDLGALKKSIESNEQRSVSILDTKEAINQINDFQLIILYQPNNKFNNLYSNLELQNKNKFVIVGTKTDLSFLNRATTSYYHSITDQTEYYLAELNINYSPFFIEDINFESFPPLLSNYGTIKFNTPFQSILEKTVRGVSTNETLLATFETNGRREAVLFGEHIWQWRAQSYLNEKSFNTFDDFIGKLIQYLASNKQKSRLNLDYESFYNGSGSIVIKAEFFDKNYVFDTRETLYITLTDTNSKVKKTFPLILKNNNYQVNLSSLPPSEYSFTVKASKENLSKSGSFQILEYNVEQQFLNADVTKLQQLATNSRGSSYFIEKAEAVIDDLLNDNRFVPIQKSSKNIIPLIDWKFLLALIALSLGLEWFLRKYNGLI
ncbi:MAG: VWA domain-containing protein [Algibacter sp.]|uniref:VWA domain-containing protein n=1 Tax=Algibacter sp. TaxID=1872428 RepID=UPI00260DC73A|nr:VWA domain-containing protein [Algibacter sp.]MDG1730869.1 VWA domain-containing protein [Algibacter sp.]MDG2179371.1 VWA domain-containing protein [Algibacter sp.]